ncbi:MAG: twin-arginine translocase subunit TatC [Acidobacteria bacterium]|nr:twin-arginine translocase subunit TatC [Acidobacteriota bacterium]
MAQPPVPAVPEADPSAAAVASPETDSSGASTADSPPEAVAAPAQTEDPAAAPPAASAPPEAASGAATPTASSPAPEPAAALPAPAGPSGPGGPPVDEEDAEEDEDGGGGKMSFLDHLDELRTRLMLSFAALAVGFMVCFGFIDPIFDFIMEPLTDVLEEGGTLIYTDATEAFFLRLKMAALAGLVIGTPVIMSQLWLFIAPGLYAHEKKFAIPFVALASIFFIGGAFFGHYILFRVAWGFFGSFGSATEYLEFTPRIQPAFTLYVRLVLACGVIFQLPTIVFFLARMGVASSSFLIRNFKYAFLLCFVVAAILTPTPDPVTMTVMAGPMLALYILSIGIAWVFQKRTAD